MQKTFKINKEFQFKKKALKNFSKICKVEEDDKFYTFSNIKNNNELIYLIAFEIVDFLYNTTLKDALSKSLTKQQVSKVLKNHEEKSYEKNHLSFIIKIKLTIFLHNNDTLNVNSFLKFNASKIYEELGQIAELEIDADGEFLEDTDVEEIDGEMSEEYSKILALVQYLKLKDLSSEEIVDLHIFRNKKNEYKILNEYGKEIYSEIDASVKSLAEEIYEDKLEKTSMEYILTKFRVYLALFDPERIILYNSLPDEAEERFLKDFAFLKITLNLNCECYKSSEDIPS